MEVLSSRILLRPTDLVRSHRFYRDTLGLAIYREFGPPEHRGLVFFLGGGFLEVLPERVTVLADVAEHADEINLEAAEEARHRAQERLTGTLTAAEETEFQNALAMAEARLRLARARRG